MTSNLRILLLRSVGAVWGAFLSSVVKQTVTPAAVWVLVLVAGIFLGASAPAFGVSCQVAAPREYTEADRAYLRGQYDEAAARYQQQLQQKPADLDSIVGLTDVYLHQQNLVVAADLVSKALAGNPHSAALETAMASIQYRQGKPWDAVTTARAALKDDPCYARVHLILARLSRLSSMYAGERDELRTAHQLDPHDPAIRRRWINLLTGPEQIAELEAYLATPTGDDPEDINELRISLDRLKKSAAEPHKNCHLVSPTNSTEIPFSLLMRDGNHIRAYALEVKINNQNARLQIDTGATGLLISRAIAQRAGLAQFARTEVAGIGSESARSSYIAYADSLRIGALEFKDCEVEVIDSKNVIDSDGLIGMDVFENFLVTLDYPMRKLALGPLPLRPNESAPATSLQTQNGSAEDAKAGSAQADASRAAGGPQNRFVAPEMKDYFPVYRVGHQLLIPTALNKSTPKLFILDTGSFKTSISDSAAREVTKVHSESFLSVKGISGKVEKVYTADEITFRFANLSQLVEGVVAFDISSISRNLGLEVSGLIGADTLGQVTTHIDYRDGLVKFEYHRNRGYLGQQ